MSSSSSSAPKQPLSQQELQRRYQILKNELNGLAGKIGELEGEQDEHALVLQTLKEVNARDPKRKCFRMIGGTLVERTVQDIIPSLETNHSGIKGVLNQLVQNYQVREQDMQKFTQENGIQVGGR